MNSNILLLGILNMCVWLPSVSVDDFIFYKLSYLMGWFHVPLHAR